MAKQIRWTILSGSFLCVGVAAFALASCGRVESDPVSAEEGAAPASHELLQPHCWRYRNVTAAIGAAVIDCQGTIGPDSFEVKDGALVPKFSSCRANAANAKVDPAVAYSTLQTLLAVQQTKEDPRIQECFAGQWNRWHELFQRTNITQCPSWTKTEVIGGATSSTLRQLAKMYARAPKAPAECEQLTERAARKACISRSIQEQLAKDPALSHEQSLRDIIPPPKTSQTYTVTSADPSCEDPGACAAQCAAAFPGFVLAAGGNRVDGDATYWLSADPPGTYIGYTHPMCQYNGPPGDLYGHINRVGEMCTRWDDFDGCYVTLLRDAHIPGLSHCGDF